MWGTKAAGLSLLGGAAVSWVWRHRHSPAVAAWASSLGTHQMAGALRVRTLGSADPLSCCCMAWPPPATHSARPTTQLPRSLPSSYRICSASADRCTPPDRLTHRHIGALDAALAALGLEHRPTIVAGHSMGGALALRWAAAHCDRVRAVITFGAPLYRNQAEADRRITGMGRMDALLAGDGPLPRAVCGWMCRHRTAASWLAVTYRPDLPVPVARSGVKHTWSTYTGSMNADRYLPLTDPRWCARLLTATVQENLTAPA